MSKRDDHLRSADFLEAEKFPDISVVVTGAEAIDSDTVDLRAQLTVKGTTAPCRCGPRSQSLDDGAVRLPLRPPSTARISVSTAT